jgi:iron complex transport system ATP-binding protein
MKHIKLNGLSIGYPNQMIFDGLNLDIMKAKITVFIGPNGCGKSTLLRCIARLLDPQTGEIFLADKNINDFTSVEFARQFAFLAQTPVAPDELTIFQLVKLGRYAHQRFLKEWSAQDSAQVEKALKATNIYDLQHRRLSEISGGQKQRAWISVVLAQNSDTIALDEPINHLDMSYQLECLNLIQQVNQDFGKTILLVLHDINLAARYADYIVAIKDGSIMAIGTPKEIVTREVIHDVFDMENHVMEDPVFKTPHCIPIAPLR